MSKLTSNETDNEWYTRDRSRAFRWIALVSLGVCDVVVAGMAISHLVVDKTTHNLNGGAITVVFLAVLGLVALGAIGAVADFFQGEQI